LCDFLRCVLVRSYARRARPEILGVAQSESYSHGARRKRLLRGRA
jgi:hypothetical protein